MNDSAETRPSLSFGTFPQMKTMRPIDPERACPFVGQTLKELRSVVGNEATVLGFVGCPYTLATYMVEVSGTPFTHLLNR